MSNKSKLKFPIYFFEDIDSGDVNESLVGRKGLSLFQLKDYDVPVPPFFVVSSGLFKGCLYEAFRSKVMDWAGSDSPPSSSELMEIVQAVEFSSEYKDEIRKNYNRLSGFADVWVSVRSSVVYTKENDASFSGIFATELNVKGASNVLQAVKNIYASVFSDKALSYYRMHGINLSDVKMAVVVQKMVQAQVSGITFTVDPVTMDNSKLSVEAVFGLGEVISSNEMTPDLYVLKKEDLSFLEKRIAPQEWMLVRKPTPVDGRSYQHSTDFVEKVKITTNWSHQQKLEDRFIEDVAKLCLIIEDKSGKPQNVEWVWESGSVWILQNKELMQEKKVIKKEIVGVADYDKESFMESAFDIVGEVKLEQDSVKEAVDLVEKRKDAKKPKIVDVVGKDVSNITRAGDIVKEVPSDKDNHHEDTDFKVVLKGVGASFGSAVGKVKQLDKSTVSKLEVDKGDILLIKDYQSDNILGIEHLVIQAGGVITEEGGLSSALAILCRESATPAVLDVDDATKELSEGLVVKIDGTLGTVSIASEAKKGFVESTSFDAEEISTQTRADDDGFLAQFEGFENDLAEFSKDDEVESEVKEKEISIPTVESGKFSDIDRLMGLKREIEHKYEQKLDKEHSKLAREKEIESIVYDEKKKIVTATKVMVDYNTHTDSAVENIDRFEQFVRLSDGICFVDVEAIVRQMAIHPISTVRDGTYAQYADRFARKIDTLASFNSAQEVILLFGSHDNMLYRSLIDGAQYTSSEGLRAKGMKKYSDQQELIKKLFKIIRKVRNKYRCRNVSVAVKGDIDKEMIIEVKKELSAAGLGRSNSFNFYVVMDKASELLFIEDMCEVGVDGIIVDFVEIVKELGGKEAISGERLEEDKVEKVVDTMIGNECVKDLRIIADIGPFVDSAGICVQNGFYGVSVRHDLLMNAKEIVMLKEQKMFR